jgi:uncharacterized membrane protein
MPVPEQTSPAQSVEGSTRESAVPTPAERPGRTEAPAPPSEDDLFARAAGAVREWFTTGNVVVKVGVIVLLFGVAFLVKYVAERTRVPIELRLTAVALGAMAMLVLGWRLRERRRDYALVIQGGAVGVLYLTVFAAFKLYHLLPGGAAFALLAAIAAFTAVLAVMQEARSLALFAVSGGFLAPILTSTGGGSHVMLFSYYALINAGILAIAWHRAWRELNLAGWVFTFAIGALWGWQYYQPRHFFTTEPFLILFFLFYVAIAVLFASRQPANLRGLVDGTLVFGTPLIGFGLQTWLTRGMEFGAAVSAAAVGGFYILLARGLWNRERSTYRLLVEAFLALGVVFLTLAIPLALDGRWTAATWALEGAGIFWIGLRQGHLPARLFGLGLQVAAGIAYQAESGYSPGAVPVLNSAFLGAVMISAAGWITARMRHLAPAEPPRKEGNLMWPAAAWGLAWWYLAGLQEIDRHLVPDLQPAAALGFAALTSAALALADRRLAWTPLRAAALFLLPVMVLALAAWAMLNNHPAQDYGWLAWPLAFAIAYGSLRRFDEALQPPVRTPAHLAALWLLLLTASWELAWQVSQFVDSEGSWGTVAWALLPTASLWALARGAGPAWPVQRHFALYAGAGAAPVAVMLLAWTLLVNFSGDGSAAPLPYLPLLNPLDLVVLATFLALYAWALETKGRRALQPLASVTWRFLQVALGVPAFVWLNGTMLRSLHHYAGVPFRLDAMLHSTLVQAAFSLLWTVTALALMYLAARRALRELWLTGAGLLAVVVVKLFTVDIAQVGGVPRIVSFLGVAVLMLVIGYLAPLPPRQEKQ